MFGFFFAEGPINNFDDAAAQCDTEKVRMVRLQFVVICLALPIYVFSKRARRVVGVSSWMTLTYAVSKSNAIRAAALSPSLPMLLQFGRFHRGMLERGVYLAPSQYEAGFTGLKHTEEDIDATIAAARDVLRSL